MSQGKTVLLIDDEQAFLEPLADALESEGYRVLKARAADEAIKILATERVNLVTIDIMLDPGVDLGSQVDSHNTGLYLCRYVRKNYPSIDAFCISVVSDQSTIMRIEDLGIRFLRKGETPLRKVLNMLRSRLTGIAYSTDRSR
jgi:two-component system, NtrC family, nitrogen regulation response regulator NtrX